MQYRRYCFVRWKRATETGTERGKVHRSRSRNDRRIRVLRSRRRTVDTRGHDHSVLLRVQTTECQQAHQQRYVRYGCIVIGARLETSYDCHVIRARCSRIIIIKSREPVYIADNNDSSSKTPTIEMYAPNTYNGAYEENLSSISEKSETYSNVTPDYNVSIEFHCYAYRFCIHRVEIV